LRNSTTQLNSYGEEDESTSKTEKEPERWEKCKKTVGPWEAGKEGALKGRQ
jgi:hypothetical protein